MIRSMRGLKVDLRPSQRIFSPNLARSFTFSLFELLERVELLVWLKLGWKVIVSGMVESQEELLECCQLWLWGCGKEEVRWARILSQILHLTKVSFS